MKKTILVVDDKINTLKVMCAILEDEGYGVFKAKNGEEALEVFQERPGIDVVLADLKMPGMNGLELFHRLRKMEVQVPFVIMTAHGTIQSAVDAMKQGVHNYLIKPLNYDELCIVLERAIRERKNSTELADLRREVREQSATKRIIGSHWKMKRVFEMLKTVSPHGCAGADIWRDRDGQGAAGPGHSCIEQPPRPSHGLHQFRSTSGQPAGGGIVRVSKGGIHRRRHQ